MSVIQVENASKIYKIGEVETRAVDGVSLAIAEGEFTAITGPSGSGKTTLLQLMGCLDRPNSGTVLINGQDVTRFSANQRADLRRDVIGFIFQFFALVPVLSAYENVELPLLLNGTGGKERKQRVTAMLDAVGLADRAKHRPDQLSGGQQQMVEMAIAMMLKPEIMLIDEPTIGLAPLIVNEIFQVIQEINADGTTILLVEQNAKRALEISDYGFVLELGHIRYSGAAEEIASFEEVYRAYLSER